MGITTKTGDNGMTSLYLGGRIRKDDIRVDIYGTLDELCSFLGMSKSLIKDKNIKTLLETIQKDLFILGAEIAAKQGFINRLEKRIDASFVKRLDMTIKTLENKRSFEECCFYLPGQSLISSTLDIARTIARRAERKVVGLKYRHMLKNTQILIYLNRLSDLLYLLARSNEKTHTRLKLD